MILAGVALRGRADRGVVARRQRVLEVGGAGECGGVGLRLELALVDVGVADVRGEDAEAQDKNRHQDRGGQTAIEPRCSRVIRRRRLMALGSASTRISALP